MQFICALTYLQQVMWQCVSLDRNGINWVDWGKGKLEHRTEESNTQTHRGGNQDFSRTYKWKEGKIRDEGCLETSPWKVWRDHFQADCANRHISNSTKVTQSPYNIWCFLGWTVVWSLVNLLKIQKYISQCKWVAELINLVNLLAPYIGWFGFGSATLP